MYPYRASSETLILNVTTNLFHYQFKPLEHQLGISTKQSFSHRLAKHGISAIKPSTLKSIRHPAESTRPTDSSCKLLARTDVLGCDAIWWNRAAVCNGHLGRCHMITTLRGNRGEWDCWTEKVKAQSGKSWENWRRRRNRGNMRRGRKGKGPRAKSCGNTEKQQGGQWVDTCRETSWQAATWGNASALGGYPPSHPATLPGPRNTPSPLLSCGEKVIQFYACSRHSGQRFGNTHKCQSAATMQTQTHLSASAPDAGKMPKMKTKLCVHGNPIRVPKNCIALLCWWQTSMLHCGRFKGKSLTVYLTFLNIRKRV